MRDYVSLFVECANYFRANIDLSEANKCTLPAVWSTYKRITNISVYVGRRNSLVTRVKARTYAYV